MDEENNDNYQPNYFGDIIFAWELLPPLKRYQFLAAMWITVMCNKLTKAWIATLVTVILLLLIAALLHDPIVNLVLGAAIGLILGAMVVISILSDILRK